VGLRERLQAKARGEIASGDLVAYGRAGGDAYDLLDDVPATGIARLAAWNAFVLQTFGDNLLASTPTAGYIAVDTADFVRVLYELVGGWLARAHAAAASPSYRLDVYVPQSLPHHWQIEPRTIEQLGGMKTTLEAIQARVASHLQGLHDENGAHERLRTLMSATDSAVDYAGKLWTRAPGQELRQTLGTTFRDGLDNAYQLGQLLAMPELLEQKHDDPAPTPPPSGPSALRIFLPGEAGFDPWCLTDPMERRHKEADPAFKEAISRLWTSDPHPERTLSIRAEIGAAQEAGAVDYMPSGGVGTLDHLAESCPWPGVMYATRPVLIGGNEIEPGDRFVFTTGGDGEDFHRAIVTLPANAEPVFPDDTVPMRGLGLGQLLPRYGRAGFGIFLIGPLL
jgi:hypothetical protein